jgi:hypothetical protein
VKSTLETPWITGAWGPHLPSVGHLIHVLATNKVYGTAALDGIRDVDVIEAGRDFVNSLLAKHLSASDKCYLVLKTPDDLRFLDLLIKMFPDSSYIHIRRDGRDVACSTLKSREYIADGMLPGYGPITTMQALQRWCDWERLISHNLALGRIDKYFRLTYETLTREPEVTMRRICEFLNLVYEEGILDYDLRQHTLPTWDLGSRGVLQKRFIDPGGEGRWKEQLHPYEMARIDDRFGTCLEELGYRRCGEFLDLSKRGKEMWVWWALRLAQFVWQMGKSGLSISAKVGLAVKQTFLTEIAKLWSNAIP